MTSLRIATYNVHRCIGSDGVHDPSRTAAVIREIAPDVIALQEVTKRSGSPGDVDQLAALAHETNLVPFQGPTLFLERGHQGNAVLTRLPVTHEQRIDLSVAGREPRGAILLDIAAGPPGGFRMLATHLGLMRSERRRQVALLRDHLNDRPRRPTVVLGDLNEWWRPGWIAPALDTTVVSSGPATFPSRFPVLALDRILTSVPLRLSRPTAHRSAAADRASDHLPLYADLSWDAHPRE